MKSKSPEKEAEIYRVVLDITMEEGLAGLKISKVAKQAGLAHGTVYIYFKNKKELINNLFQKTKQTATQILLSKDSLEGDFVSALRQVWEKYLLYLIHNQKEIHFMQQCINSPFLEEESKQLSNNFMLQMNAFFERGKQEQQIKAIHTELILSVFSGLAKELVQKINQGILVVDDTLLQNSFELCWSAVKR